MSGLFNPDPELPFWLTMVPTDEDILSATEDQRILWVNLNAHIAYVHTAWALLESALATLFSSVLKIKIAEAQVVLGSLTANRPKRDLIQNCANLSLLSDLRVKQVERILRRTTKAASKRNFLAHGAASYHQKYPDRVTVVGYSADLKPALGHYLSYALEDLITLRKTIDAISADAQRIAPSIWRARRRPLPQTPLHKSDQDQAVFANNIRQPRP